MMSIKQSAENLAAYNLVVVIPAYKVEKQITQTIERIPVYIRHIIVVNDESPDKTAEGRSRTSQELKNKALPYPMVS